MNSSASPAPKYSVLITSYRSLRFLPNLFGSVLGATGPSFEVLFLVNGSPDPEAEWIRENIRDPRLQVFQLEQTRYFAGGMNYLTKRARGEFLVMLNADTRVEPDWLEKMDAYLTATGFEAAAAEIRGADGAPGSPPGFRLDRMGMVVEVPEREITPPYRMFLVCGAAFAIRRDVFFELGALDETFRMYWEDTDLCWHANLAGYRVGYVPGAVVYHVGAGSSRKAFFQWTHFRMIRNRILAFAKNASLPVLATFLGVTLLLRVATLPANLLLGRIGKAVSEVAAVASVLYYLPGALWRRRKVQASRKVTDDELMKLGFLMPGFKYFDWATLRGQLPFLPAEDKDAGVRHP